MQMYMQGNRFIKEKTVWSSGSHKAEVGNCFLKCVPQSLVPVAVQQYYRLTWNKPSQVTLIVPVVFYHSDRKHTRTDALTFSTRLLPPPLPALCLQPTLHNTVLYTGNGPRRRWYKVKFKNRIPDLERCVWWFYPTSLFYRRRLKHNQWPQCLPSIFYKT